jgi:hypothetical protein
MTSSGFNTDNRAGPVDFKGGDPDRIGNPEVRVRPSTATNTSVKPSGTSSEESEAPDRPDLILFDLENDQEDTNLPPNKDATSNFDASADLMRWHLRLGHLPFANIRLIAARKEIPSRLANCRILKCQSFLYMARQPSVLGELRGNQGKSRRLRNQGSVSRLTNWNLQWLALLDKTRATSFASATRSQPSLWITSAGCPMSTFKSLPSRVNQGGANSSS